MGRITLLPRIISPASIRHGDVIRVSWKTDDVKRTIEGKVGTKRYEGSIRVFESEEGHELLRWHPELKTGVTVTLVAESKEIEGETMLEFFEHEGRI